MNIGAVCSNGVVSMRTTPSIGTVVPVWVTISSSAGSDIYVVLLCERDLLFSNLVDERSVEKGCKRRDFVGRTFGADHRKAIDVAGAPYGCSQSVRIGDIDRWQSREQRGQAGSELAGRESVVAVDVVV